MYILPPLSLSLSLSNPSTSIATEKTILHTMPSSLLLVQRKEKDGGKYSIVIVGFIEINKYQYKYMVLTVGVRLLAPPPPPPPKTS